MRERPPYFGLMSMVRVLLETLSTFISLFIRARPTRITHIDPQDKILSKPASVLASAIKSGQLKSEQVVESFIAQIEKVNPVINAVVAKHYEQALERAREIDTIVAEALEDPEARRRHEKLLGSPLLGVPFTCKESVALEGAPFTAGIHPRRDIKATYSSPGVEQLKRHGLIPLASTNTPAMNIWYDAYNLLNGRTLNPYDLSRIPGGSSGGEGAILAASGSCLGVGSDLAGSIRIPANFCGVFGHKPTPEVISTRGLYPAHKFNLLAAAGPMTRFACDLRPALALMVTSEEAHAKLRLDEPVDLRKVKIYYCEQLGDPLASRPGADVRTALQAAVQHLKSSHRMEARQVTLDEFKYGLLLWRAELEGKLLYYPEHPEGLFPFSPYWQLAKSFLGRNEIPFNAIVMMLLDRWTKFRGPRAKMSQLGLARATAMRKKFNELVGSDGVLIMPAFPEPAPPHALSLLKFPNISYTGIVNVLHAPVTQCPMGKSRSGLPVGLQLIAAPNQDRLTIAVACELDKAFKGWQPAD